MIEKGDLVIKRGKHEAKVYFVEDVNAESILLVNGVRDEYFEGEKDIECFHKQFRLLAKAEHLIEEEKKYNVILPNILRDRKPILLCKSFDDHESCGIDWSPKDWLDDNMDRHIFTEQEIKDIDERYLAFKVEVTPE